MNFIKQNHCRDKMCVCVELISEKKDNMDCEKV